MEKINRSANEDNRKVTRITNKQLGAVYLKIEGLDKERFKRLTEGMRFYSTVGHELNDGYSYIEHFNQVVGFEWLSTTSPDAEAQLITLDELEERLFPFTLPEKWCIRITPENKEILADWRTDGDQLGNFVKGKFNGWYLHTPMNGKNGYNRPSKEEGYTEITFEQFKKHILNDNNNYNMVTKEQPKTFKVTRQALGEVYEAVCQEWRDTITLLLEGQKFNSEIGVNEDLVKKAHVQSSSAHNPKVVKEWLDKYLPLPKKKKIEIVGCLYSSSESTHINYSDYLQRLKLLNPKLIKIGYGSGGLDVFSAEDEDESFYVFIGYWNEGNLED